MANRPFQVICEIEPPTRPDLMHVRHQIGTLSKVADTFLIQTTTWAGPRYPALPWPMRWRRWGAAASPA